MAVKRVQVLRPIASMHIEYDEYLKGDAVHVDVKWRGGKLDRTDGGGFVFKANPLGMGYAKRLVAAINAGVVYTNAKVLRDVNGRTYVQADKQVMAKYANSDLRRLGF